MCKLKVEAPYFHLNSGFLVNIWLKTGLFKFPSHQKVYYIYLWLGQHAKKEWVNSYTQELNLKGEICNQNPENFDGSYELFRAFNYEFFHNYQ